MSVPRFLCLAVLLAAPFVNGQTTQAFITGRIMHAVTRDSIPGASLLCVNESTGTAFPTGASANGAYLIAAIPPGLYRLRASAPGHQSLEVRRFQVPVAGLVTLDFPLRPADDIWETSQHRAIVAPGSRKLSKFYGPDLDFSRVASFEPLSGEKNTLWASISSVITPREIELLPLPGRDVYSTLLLSPGVTSSTATARGLGLSVNGQRFTASNYLLDGVENNAYLTSGLLVPQAPEAVQEYRISIANFSPEYGRTTGFVVNAVTRAGLSAWNGLAYFNLLNDVLNANEVERRYAAPSLPRAPVKEIQPGGTAGGPLVKDRLFAFASFDYLRNRGRGLETTVPLPTTRFVNSVLARSPQSPAYRLFSRFKIPTATSSDPSALSADSLFQPTESVDRRLFSAKADWLPSSANRFFARVVGSFLTRPDFISSPYPDFTSPLDQNSLRFAAGWNGRAFAWDHEARFSTGPDRTTFERAHPDVPSLAAGDAILPSSPLSASFNARGSTQEASYNAIRGAGRFIFRAGAGFLSRGLTVYLGQPEGRYLFQSLQQFGADAPSNFILNVSRLESSATRLEFPQFERPYRYNQASSFFQTSYRFSSRLLISGGLRYDHFGPPHYSSPGLDALLKLGDHGPPSERIRTSTLVRPPDTRLGLYSARPDSWQPRLGFSLLLHEKSATILRGGYGLFADRPFDNLWLNTQINQAALAESALGNVERNYLQPAQSLLNTLYSPAPGPGQVLLRLSIDSNRIIAYEPRLRNPRLESTFLTFEHQLSSAWTIAANTLFSRTRYLTANDNVNRDVGFPRARPNRSLPSVYYRNDDGYSNYRALIASASYRTRRSLLQVNYTWSRSRDNQSDALAGDFDLLVTSISSAAALRGTATFTRNYDFHADYGPSDFDQHHNLVFYSLWRLPSPLQAGRKSWLLDGWVLSQTAAIRSGTPFSVYATRPDPFDPVRFLNNRANLTCAAGYTIDEPLPRGRSLLSPDCFTYAARGQLGDTGRNAFYGPGLFNLDASISKSVPLSWLGEAGRITLRADAYNLLNHANLNNPESRVHCDTPDIPGCNGVFGQALYGRRESAPAFPAQKPLVESGRRVQILLRLEF